MPKKVRGVEWDSIVCMLFKRTYLMHRTRRRNFLEQLLSSTEEMQDSSYKRVYFVLNY